MAAADAASDNDEEDLAENIRADLASGTGETIDSGGAATAPADDDDGGEASSSSDQSGDALPLTMSTARLFGPEIEATTVSESDDEAAGDEAAVEQPTDGQGDGSHDQQHAAGGFKRAGCAAGERRARGDPQFRHLPGDGRRRRGRGRAAPAFAPAAPLQDPGGHQAPADHAGAGDQGRARQQGRRADDLSVAGRPLLRADAEHRPRRRHLPQDHQRRRPQAPEVDPRGARHPRRHGGHRAHRRQRAQQDRDPARLRISPAACGTKSVSSRCSRRRRP